MLFLESVRIERNAWMKLIHGSTIVVAAAFFLTAADRLLAASSPVGPNVSDPAPEEDGDLLNDPAFFYDIYFHHFPRLNDPAPVNRAVKDHLMRHPKWEEKMDQRLFQFSLSSQRWADMTAIVQNLRDQFVAQFGPGEFRQNLVLDPWKTVLNFLQNLPSYNQMSEARPPAAQIHQMAVDYAIRRFRVDARPQQSEEESPKTDKENEKEKVTIDPFSAYASDPDFMRFYTEGRLRAEQRSVPQPETPREAFEEARDFLLTEIAETRRRIWESLFEYLSMREEIAVGKTHTNNEFNPANDGHRTEFNLSRREVSQNIRLKMPTPLQVWRAERGDFFPENPPGGRQIETFTFRQAHGSEIDRQYSYESRYNYPKEYTALSSIEIPATNPSLSTMLVPIDALRHYLVRTLREQLSRPNLGQRYRLLALLESLRRDWQLNDIAWALTNPEVNSVEALAERASHYQDPRSLALLKLTLQQKVKEYRSAMGLQAESEQEYLSPDTFHSSLSDIPLGLGEYGNRQVIVHENLAAVQAGKASVLDRLALAWLTEKPVTAQKNDGVVLEPTMTGTGLSWDDVKANMRNGSDLMAAARDLMRRESLAPWKLEASDRVEHRARLLLLDRNEADFKRANPQLGLRRSWVYWIFRHTRGAVERGAKPVIAIDEFNDYFPFASWGPPPTLGLRLHQYFSTALMAAKISSITLLSTGGLFWVGNQSTHGSGDSYVEMPDAGAARNDPASYFSFWGGKPRPTVAFAIASHDLQVPPYYNVFSRSELETDPPNLTPWNWRPYSPNEPHVGLFGHAKAGSYGIPLPIPDGYELRELALENSGQQVPAQVVTDSTGRALARPVGRSESAYSFSITVTPKAETPPAPRKDDAPWTLDNKSRLLTLASDLREVGFEVLADRILDSVNHNEKLPLENLASLFDAAGLYSHDPRGREKWTWRANSFHRFRAYARDGVFCGECDGSNNLLINFLKRFYADQPEIAIAPLISYVGQTRQDPKFPTELPVTAKAVALSSPLHQRTLVFNEQTGNYRIVDATSSALHPDEQKKQASAEEFKWSPQSLLDAVKLFVDIHPQLVDMGLATVALIALLKSRRELRRHLESLPKTWRTEATTSTPDTSFTDSLDTPKNQASIEPEPDLEAQMKALEAAEEKARAELAGHIAQIRDALIQSIEGKESGREGQSRLQISSSRPLPDSLLRDALRALGALSQAVAQEVDASQFVKHELRVEPTASPSDLRSAVLVKLQELERFASLASPGKTTSSGRSSSPHRFAVLNRNALQKLEEAHALPSWGHAISCSNSLRDLRDRAKKLATTP